MLNQQNEKNGNKKMTRLLNIIAKQAKRKLKPFNL